MTDQQADAVEPRARLVEDDQQAAPERHLTTDQIASAGVRDRADTDTDAGAQSRHLERDDNGDVAGRADAVEPHTPLFEDDELESVRSRWREIQAQFVDDPRSAVQEADALVADLMQRLARMFAIERDQLESHWKRGEDVSTEDLRQGLQRYRSFFERLLAV
jgi:hypothetical protein